MVTWNLFWGLGLAGAAAAQGTQRLTGPNTGVKSCDALLYAGLEDIVAFPGGEAYRNSTSSYWDYSCRKLEPFCIVQPRSTEEVSKVVKALGGVSSAGSWDVAIRSGGHSDWETNAIGRGVTIDFSNFRDIELDFGACKNPRPAIFNGTHRETKVIAKVRPAATWLDVFSELEKWNLGAAGGRSGYVGVAGLILGGGMGFHFGRRGFSCDGVANFEVVLADGSIVNANATSNPDLFKSLKGGGNNFGIVTRIDLRTFTVPSTGVYGGMAVVPWSKLDAMHDQFLRYNEGVTEAGTDDHQFFYYYHTHGSPTPMLIVAAANTAGHINSSLSDLWSVIGSNPSIRKQPLSQIALAAASHGGEHNVPFANVVNNRKEVLDYIAELYLKLVDDLAATGLQGNVNFVFQPFHRHVAEISKRDGGNVLGVDVNPPKTNQILFDARITLPTTEGSAQARALVATLMSDLKYFSDQFGETSPYIYLNYANPTQDPLAGYGDANIQFMKETAAKYDPTGFFTNRVPGGFKLDRM